MVRRENERVRVIVTRSSAVVCLVLPAEFFLRSWNVIGATSPFLHKVSLELTFYIIVTMQLDTKFDRVRSMSFQPVRLSFVRVVSGYTPFSASFYESPKIEYYGLDLQFS